MPRSAIQLYTLRNVAASTGEILDRIERAGFDGVELAPDIDESEDETLREALPKTGLEVAGAHVQFERLEADLDATIARCERLGVEDVVIPWLDAKHFESVDSVRAVATRIASIGSELAARGMDLHYHNHHHEFTAIEGASAASDETAFDSFVDATECGIELDLGLAFRGGDDVVARLRSLGPRSRLVHLRDFDRGRETYVPFGEGDLDHESCAAAIHECERDWLISEYEGEDPLGSLEDAAERTNALCAEP